MNDTIWVINKSSKDFERTDIDLKKHIIIKPQTPIPLPASIALKYVSSFRTLSICDNPEQYFTGTKQFEYLLVRDAGIGDLLLLEPIIRQMKKLGNRSINVLTRFPEVYENHPDITRVYKMKAKAHIELDLNQFHAWDDLRSYSETCKNRDKWHRTDCYSDKFSLDIEDKEPRLYFAKDEKQIFFNKKKGKTYIGVQCDASHSYRRFLKSKKLCEQLVKHDRNNVVVLLGDEKYVDFEHKRVIDLQGETSIRDAINVVKDLDYMIGVDSGLVHVACTLHIPTLAIFTIISPQLRLKYYTGVYRAYTKQIGCIGCGNHHMHKCQFGDIKDNMSFIPPCLDINVPDIYNEFELLKQDVTGKPTENKAYIAEEKKQNDFTNFNIKNLSTKLVMPIIVQNEEHNLPRFIENVMKHPCIGKTIAIDGGSDDKTVEILRKAGAEVYVHNYDKDYHDMQALQRNISCSFVEDGSKIIIMDLDECFSKELSDYLPYLCECDTVYGEISRRTFEYYKDINIPSKQIKDYPDWQPRFFTWDRKFKWVGSPHHIIHNVPNSVKISKDIIHFEREGKDRDQLEQRWSVMQKNTRRIYG